MIQFGRPNMMSLPVPTGWQQQNSSKRVTLRRRSGEHIEEQHSDIERTVNLDTLEAFPTEYSITSDYSC